MTVESVPDGTADLGLLRFDRDGLIPVVAQDIASGEVLLLAYMNAEALRLTLAERMLVLWSRSRGRLWRKGEQSGHRLQLCELRLNCENTSLLARVRLDGPGACHAGYRSCFYRRIEANADGRLAVSVVMERVFDPDSVYGSSSSAEREFEQETRTLYHAYERLRDDDLIQPSTTARLFRSAGTATIARRALERGQEELTELRGVLEGSHRHRGGADDIILEASQVGYWAMVAAVASHTEFDDWRPDRAWLAGYDGREPPCHDRDATLADCAELLRATGVLCREAGIHPARVVAADLAAMRAKHPGLSGTSL